jgi:hypothetical protein
MNRGGKMGTCLQCQQRGFLLWKHEGLCRPCYRKLQAEWQRVLYGQLDNRQRLIYPPDKED